MGYPDAHWLDSRGIGGKGVYVVLRLGLRLCWISWCMNIVLHNLNSPSQLENKSPWNRTNQKMAKRYCILKFWDFFQTPWNIISFHSTSHASHPTSSMVTNWSICIHPTFLPSELQILITSRKSQKLFDNSSEYLRYGDLLLCFGGRPSKFQIFCDRKSGEFCLLWTAFCDAINFPIRINWGCYNVSDWCFFH